MARREEAEAAVKDPNPTIDGRRANVNLAYLGAKNRMASLPRKLPTGVSIVAHVRVSFSLSSQLQCVRTGADVPISGRVDDCIPVRIDLISTYYVRR